MFIAGYVYTTNPKMPGFNPEPPFSTKKEAEEWIRERLAGKKVTFATCSGETGRLRAYADGDPTAYIYFEVKVPDTWYLIDQQSLGTKAKAVIAKGDLAKVKVGAREFLEKEYEVKKCVFKRTKDNIEVLVERPGLNWGDLDTGLVIVKG